MKFAQKSLLTITLLLASNLFYAGSMDVDKAQGPITKLTVSNENNQEPGFTICVNDAKYKEVCMWRRYGGAFNYNYQQLLDVANMAMIANKKVMIQANMVGSLDAITVYN